MMERPFIRNVIAFTEMCDFILQKWLYVFFHVAISDEWTWLFCTFYIKIQKHTRHIDTDSTSKSPKFG